MKEVAVFIRIYELTDGKRTRVKYSNNITGTTSTVRTTLTGIVGNTELDIPNSEIEVHLRGSLDDMPVPIADWWPDDAE